MPITIVNMNIKIHKTEYSLLIALCDKELVGKTIEDKEFHIKLTERFYLGENLPEKRAIEILKDADSVNIVGKDSIKVALKAKIIKKENIKKIKGIPIAISV